MAVETPFATWYVQDAGRKGKAQQFAWDINRLLIKIYSPDRQRTAARTRSKKPAREGGAENKPPLRANLQKGHKMGEGVSFDVGLGFLCVCVCLFSAPLKQTAVKATGAKPSTASPCEKTIISSTPAEVTICFPLSLFRSGSEAPFCSGEIYG